METTLSTKDGANYIADTWQRLRLKEIDADEARECMAYVKSRMPEADYQMARASAAAYESRR